MKIAEAAELRSNAWASANVNSSGFLLGVIRTAREWDYSSVDLNPSLFGEERRTPVHPSIEDDLAFNIRFERCRMEMEKIVAAFLFDVHPLFFDLIEEGKLAPTQSQIFKMLLAGFNLEASCNGIISDTSIFSACELEFKLLRMYAHANHARRRIFNERFFATLQSLYVPYNKIDRQRLLKIVIADAMPIRD